MQGNADLSTGTFHGVYVAAAITVRPDFGGGAVFSTCHNITVNYYTEKKDN